MFQAEEMEQQMQRPLCLTSKEADMEGEKGGVRGDEVGSYRTWQSMVRISGLALSGMRIPGEFEQRCDMI